MAGIVHFSIYFRYMEEAEHALWRAAGLRIATAGEETGWPRIAAAFDYKAPLRFEEEFDVFVRLAAVTRRTLEYAFTLRRGPTLIGSGSMTVACVSKRPGEPMKALSLPSDTIDRLREAAATHGQRS